MTTATLDGRPGADVAPTVVEPADGSRWPEHTGVVGRAQHADAAS